MAQKKASLQIKLPNTFTFYKGNPGQKLHNMNCNYFEIQIISIFCLLCKICFSLWKVEKCVILWANIYWINKRNKTKV